jgi:uncharacterized protein
MKLNLQELAKKAEKCHIHFSIEERLPPFLLSPCGVEVHYQVERALHYYLLSLETQADLKIICQRCFEECNIPYHNETMMAICQNEEQEKALSKQYEVIIAPDLILHLEDIVTDELYLYAPQHHLDKTICDVKIKPYLVED